MAKNPLIDLYEIAYEIKPNFHDYLYRNAGVNENGSTCLWEIITSNGNIESPAKGSLEAIAGSIYHFSMQCAEIVDQKAGLLQDFRTDALLATSCFFYSEAAIKASKRSSSSYLSRRQLEELRSLSYWAHIMAMDRNYHDNNERADSAFQAGNEARNLFRITGASRYADAAIGCYDLFLAFNTRNDLATEQKIADIQKKVSILSCRAKKKRDSESKKEDPEGNTNLQTTRPSPSLISLEEWILE